MFTKITSTGLHARRNFGICAHVDAGKTTCTEQVLYLTGEKRKAGKVDDGTTTTDFLKVEQERGITVQSAAVSTHWQVEGNKFSLNLIDTPGHVDFTIEVERSMRVLDGVVILLCAKGGVQPQTRTVWRQAARYEVPRLVFINKMDTIGADFHRCVKQIGTELKAKPAVLQLPIGEKSEFVGVVDLLSRQALVWEDCVDQDGTKFRIEEVPSEMRDTVEQAREQLVCAIAECDDQLAELYLLGEVISVDDLRLALRQAVQALKLVPVLCGSAFRKKGVQPLLDAVVQYLPSPMDVPPVEGLLPIGQKGLRKTDPAEPLSALAFKITDDPHGDLVFVRVYSGVLKAGKQVYNERSGKQERVAQIYQVQAEARISVDELGPGDIGAVVGVRDIMTGDTLCTRDRAIKLESIVCPEPVISQALEPLEGGRDSAKKLSEALFRLRRADPSFRYWVDEESGQTLIAGLGELHLDIKRGFLEDEGIATRVGKPQVSYRETISRHVSHEHTVCKQNGGHGQYARVVLEVEPLPPGSGFVFEDATTGGCIKQAFVGAVEHGVRDALSNGTLAGYQVIDLKVTLVDGKMHDVDSSEMAFHRAGLEAFRAACEKAEPVLLEPLMKIDVDVPSEHMGGVLGDLHRLRSKIVSTDVQESALLTAEIPLGETFGYSTRLRSATQGKGNFTLEFLRYEAAPAHIRDQVAGNS